MQVEDTERTPPQQQPFDLADALRESTRMLHARAEQSGIIREILSGRSSKFGYALFLRNLLPAYREMERGLELHRNVPAVCAIAQPAVYRASNIESDLKGLCGPGWRQLLPLLDAGEHYRRRVVTAADGDGTRLIAHAYARYLGDLSGGRIIKRALERSLSLGPDTLAFYDFPDIPDARQFKEAFRDAINRSARDIPDVARVIDEAAIVFQLNIDVSNAVLIADGARTGQSW